MVASMVPVCCCCAESHLVMVGVMEPPKRRFGPVPGVCMRSWKFWYSCTSGLCIKYANPTTKTRLATVRRRRPVTRRRLLAVPGGAIPAAQRLRCPPWGRRGAVNACSWQL